MQTIITAGVDEEEYAGLVRLLNIPRERRTSEDVFEIANSLYRASFVRQLDVVTRSGIARYAEAFEIIPGEHVPLSEDGENDLYIILSGSVKAEAAGLEFLPGDTFGFRAPTSPSFQLMTETPVVTCATRGLAAKVPFDYCIEFWPEMDSSDSDDSQQEQPESDQDSGQNLVWSPELARSILLRGGAEGEEALVALEYLNFPPINGHSAEVREILVSEFKMRRDVKDSVFLEWTNRMPINPNDIQLSRVDCDQVVMVVSGCLEARCRRRHSGSDGGDGYGEFTLMRLQAGDVFPPQSGLMMMGSRLRKDKSDLDQEAEEDWEDFDICSLVGDSSESMTEILLVDAHVFHDVIYPGIDLFYSMEPVRSILSKGPGLRTWREINYIARNVLSHHVAFQQMSSSSLERIASRLTDRMVVPGGEVLVECGQSVTSFLILLRGSARIMEISKTLKARSATRRAKVGRLEPGDLWGMQHTHEEAEARFEIVAVEGCELIRGDIELVRAAEKQPSVHLTVGARAMRSLAVLPENRTPRDVRNIVDELSTPRSALDIARFRRIPVCLKTRIAAALRLEVWPAFFELKRDEKKDPNTYFFIIKGSLSLQAVTKANRFNMETLDMPATGQLKSLDVDNGLALEDWRASGLGPCVAIYFDRQVVGEYPHSEENILRVRAVTRQETTAAVVDGDVYAEHLVNDGMNYSDSHSEVCREVLAQLKKYPRDYPGVGGLESDILCRLLKENPVLKRISTSCLPRLTGSIALKQYDPGEVITEAEDYGDNLYIILEGFLEYAVQESHRGVMDRSLAKEVGIAPGLRCVGVMTAGDFFAPESMLGKRRGRRPRVLSYGSYRIRCSTDLQIGGTGGGGAICLVLPREKVEVAVHRDRQVQRSRLLQTSAVMSNDELQDPPGRPTATTSAQPNTLRKVNFGGPGDPGGLDGQGTDSHDYARDSSALAEEGRRGQSKEEGHTGQNMVVKPGTEGAALVNDDGTDLSECAKLPKQLLTQMTVLAGVLKTGETGDKRQRQRPRQQNQQREQAFLTGVPPPHVGSDGPEVPPGTPMSNISTTIARLHDLENSPSRAPASAGSGGGCDADSAERRAIAGLPRSTEKATGVLAGFGSNPPHDMTHASSLGNPSTNGSADVSPGQGQSEDRSAAARTPLWADGSHPSRASCPHDGGSNYREDYRTWRMGSGSRSSAAAAASDQEESGASSVFVRGEIGIDGGMQRVEGRRVEGIVMSALGPTTTTAISSNTECAGNTNKETDKDSSLLGFLRSFVSSHVDSFKADPRVNDSRAAWVTPRQDASGRLLADELALAGRLSGDVFTAPSGEGDKQLARDSSDAPALRMTPLCCHQMLPPTTSGRTTARGDRNNNKSGGGGVGQTPPEADPRSKEATSGWERETLSKADGKRYRNRRNDHRHCSGRATWRLTEHGNQCSSGSRGSEAGPRDDARSGEHRDSQPRRHGGEHSQRQPNRVAPEIEGRRRHRDPSSATSSCQRERSKTKHRKLKPEAHDTVDSAVPPVQPPRWSRPSKRGRPPKNVSSMEKGEVTCIERNGPSTGAREEETGDETHSPEGSDRRRHRREDHSRPTVDAPRKGRDRTESPQSMRGEDACFSGAEGGARNTDAQNGPEKHVSSSGSRRSGSRGRSCSSHSDGGGSSGGSRSSSSSSSSSSSRERNATTAASCRWRQETHGGETRQQTQPQQLLIGYFNEKCDDDTSFATTGVLAARSSNSARRAAGKVTRTAAAGVSSKSRAAASTQPESCGSVAGCGMIYDVSDQSSVLGGQDQRRPCTGAPSHGWRSLLLSRGGRGTTPADHVDVTYPCSPRQLVSRVDPTMLSQLPPDGEVRARCSRGLKNRCELLPDVVDTDRGVTRRSSQRAGNTALKMSKRGVKCRKQPSVVRRLKITLRELNDPHSEA